MKNLLSAKLVAAYEYKVTFFDLDPMNIMWHGNYPKLLELARSELLDLCGYNIKEMKETGFVFPIIDLKVKYIHPLTYEQEVIIHAGLKEYVNRIKVVYTITDKNSQNLLTKAETTQVAVKAGHVNLEFITPQIWRDKIERFLK